MKRIFGSAFLALFLFANLNCSGGNKTFTAPYSGAVVDKYCSNPNRFLVIETKQGMMKIQLFDKVAPNHVAQITKLAKEGMYNGCTFHRVYPGFMIQGGDPNSKDNDLSNDGTGSMGEKLKAEFNEVHHFRGVCSICFQPILYMRQGSYELGSELLGMGATC